MHSAYVKMSLESSKNTPKKHLGLIKRQFRYKSIVKSFDILGQFKKMLIGKVI